MGNNLKNEREKANLSQVEVATKTQITVMSYSRYETGKREPRARTAIQIAQTLGTTVEALWGGNPTIEEKPDGNRAK